MKARSLAEFRFSDPGNGKLMLEVLANNRIGAMPSKTNFARVSTNFGAGLTQISKLGQKSR